MWGRMVSDYGSGLNSFTAGTDFPTSGWLASPLWHSSVTPPSGRSSHTRRHSITSDSGDTGIGTSCSDSLEDHSTSSGTSTFKPVTSLVCLPTAHVMPSTARSSLPRHREDKLDTSCWDGGYSLPGAGRTCGHSDTPLDMKDSRPMKKWSSLSKLSTQEAFGQDSRVDKAESRHSLERMGRESSLSQQSRAYRPACLHYSMEALKLDEKDGEKKDFLDIDLKYKYDSFSASDFTKTAAQTRRHTLDMTYSALPESKPSTSDSYLQKHSCFGYQAGAPLQSSLRTQMWLSDQFHAHSQDRRTPEESCCLSAWSPLERLQQNPELTQATTTPTRPSFSSVPLSQDVSKWESLLKIKEGLIRQKEIVIDRQRQQICHLQQAIRGGDLRTHPASSSPVMNGEECYVHGLKGSPCESCKHLQNLTLDRLNPLLRDKGDLEGKLSPSEMGAAPINEAIKQSAIKPSDDMKKMDEKIKTRDKYISSLRKKCQKENELNREKQRRIETLEKYVADLPTLDDVQRQSERLQVLEEENKQLKDTIRCLEKVANESRIQFQEKEAQTECQKQREKELVLTIQNLQLKVQKCLDDGVRLPMLDAKQLQSENEWLREQTERSNKVIDNQQSQIDSMAVEIQTLRGKLFQEGSSVMEFEKKFAEQEDCTQTLNVLSLENQKFKEENASMCKQLEELLVSRQPLSEKMLVAEQLFKEMSHCLFDLKALCSILTQRVQGKEPNLTLLLGIRSANSCSEESETSRNTTENLTRKLADTRQLRKDIDELRTTLSDCYAQDMGENCITQ